MNVNNREINLYNFNDGNDIGYYDISGKEYSKIFDENTYKWSKVVIIIWYEKTSYF